MSSTHSTIRPHLVALLACHNEMRFLPGWFECLANRVSAIVVLDDGSTDGSSDYLASHPEVKLLIRNDAKPDRVWDEPANRRVLIKAGQSLGAEWFLTMDADERLEDSFWHHLDDLILQAEIERTDAFRFRLREMWDNPNQYRCDGIWGRKTKVAFFRNYGDLHQFDETAWHGEWVSVDSLSNGRCRDVPFDVFHLRMIHVEDREARRKRYNKLDPNRTYQAIGYDYLTDVSGLEVRAITPSQSYRGMPTVRELNLEEQ